MPLLRYFAYVGGALLALLFVVNWSLPQLNAEPERADADRSTIRIHSQHKWPAAVVMDTTQPTIVPPAAPVVAEAPIAKPVREAFALATEAAAVKPAEAIKPAKPHARRARVARAPAHPVDSYDPFGFRPLWVARW
jgi:hypothetical protein